MRERSVKHAMLMLLALLLFSVESAGNIHGSRLPDNSTDMLSLLDFRKAITNDPSRILNSWNTSTPFCEWKGVSCSLKHPGRVTVLDLRDQGLSGQISPSLGNLTFLKALNLSANRFSGELPPFNRLGELQNLSLVHNLLEGNIPDGLTNCSKLMLLGLSGNMLVGQIPRKLASLTNLKILALNRNNLTGVIPPMLNMTNLEYVSLSDNQLEGSIPEELGQLPKMQFLYLGVNILSGRIPPSLFNMSSLKLLDLDTNNLGGALPSNAGQALHNLETLLLGDNMIEGQIPTSLGNASGLVRIDLSSNNFNGPISNSLGKLRNLNHLNLQNNKLQAEDAHSWKFLDALSNCSLLNVLSLYNNQLQGVIPRYVGNLSTSLEQLVLGRNNLSGIVPPTIAKLRGLIALELGSNNFTGTVEWIGSLEELQILNLHSNNLIGSIPSSIGNLTQLTMISLAENKFDGVIPQSLGNLRRLSDLDLSGNNLQGNIPLEVSSLIQLTQLSLSRNKFTGEIPYGLGQCLELTIIQMDENLLTGNIPISLSNLLSLITLNLSHNNLSGTIPVGLGNLSVLTHLDLSFNHLQGQVPRNGVFENATAVSLNSNWGLCGGIHELHLPSCGPVSRRANKQYYLVRILIPLFGVMSLLTLIYFILVNKKIPIKIYLSLFSAGEEFLKVSYMELAQATRNFSEANMIGRGSYSTVYKGKLSKIEVDVAVKIFDLEMKGAEKSFLSECEALRSIRHRNLLPIITTCSTVDPMGNPFKALIYEFMPRGNLDTWLHHRGDERAPITTSFGLPERLCVAVNIADALDYLHNDTGRPIIHCDLKPTNILLDNDMIARLGDFGIARFFDNSRSTSIGESCSYSWIIPKGTIGYIAPEYAGGGHASTCGDVYSFGVVLLEILTGKRPTDRMFENGLTIVNFVERSFPDHILHVVDAHIQEEFKDLTQAMVDTENVTLQCLLSLLQVALSCTRHLPRERMNMRDVATEMQAIKATYEEGKTKNCPI